jgi:hypothetical protein
MILQELRHGTAPLWGSFEAMPFQNTEEDQ